MSYVYIPYKESNNVKKKRQQQDTATTMYQNYYKNPYITGQGGLGSQLSSIQQKQNNLDKNNTLSQQFTYGPAKQKLYDKAYSDLVNRKPFEYDLANDQLFQQYKDNYQAMGKAAMADTMGQAAAMTGGYGNSYATAAANQTYNNYLQQINNSIGDFYQMALSGYQTENDRLNNVFGAASSDRTTAQNEWKGNWDVYNNLYKMYSDEYNNLLNQDISLYGQRGSALGNVADLYTKQYGTESDKDLNQWSTGENLKYNKASLDETATHNRNTEQLSRDQLNESIRSNKASEGINTLKALYSGSSGGNKKSKTTAKNSRNAQQVIGLVKADLEDYSRRSGSYSKAKKAGQKVENIPSAEKLVKKYSKEYGLENDEMTYVYYALGLLK